MQGMVRPCFSGSRDGEGELLSRREGENDGERDDHGQESDYDCENRISQQVVVPVADAGRGGTFVLFCFHRPIPSCSIARRAVTIPRFRSDSYGEVASSPPPRSAVRSNDRDPRTRLVAGAVDGLQAAPGVVYRRVRRARPTAAGGARGNSSSALIWGISK